MPAKKNAFDLSLYPKFNSAEDIFDVIMSIGSNCSFEYEFYNKLDDIISDSNNPLSSFINSIVASLIQYFETGYISSTMADKQAKLLTDIDYEVHGNMKYIIESSHNTGMNIKGRTVRLLSGDDIIDPILNKTLKRIITTNPFLSVALDALADWDNWSATTFEPQDHASLRDYLISLWNDTTNNKYAIRRLLLRIYTNESINYIQDLNIEGIDEHNLYSGTPSPQQTSEICDYLLEKYNDNHIASVTDLYNLLISNRAKTLINDSLKFERINGTSLKPSFFYLEEYLLPRYELVNFDEANLPAPIAYYSKFVSNLNVRPYDNLKVIRNSETKRNLAIVKGKFFRQPEFPRRVKEESYVGLTAQYTIEDDTFKKRYGSLPFIMFIDMADNYTPPAFAVRRLVNYGWHPYFELDKLIEYLESLEEE
jgi:hypothetical protein